MTAAAATKMCTACKEERPASREFFWADKIGRNGLSPRCIECARRKGRADQKRYRSTDAGRLAKKASTKRWEKSEAGRAKVLAAGRAYRERNREKIAAEHKARRMAETEEQRARRMATAAAYRRRMRKSNPQFRLRLSLSSRIATALRTRGTSKRHRNWESLVGYSLENLRAHIERQFSRGMSWENYGEWHVDHIVPAASFRWQSPEDADFKACWALSNLRPLWADDNRRKKAKRLHLL